ncbi:MAG: amino acid synthesis family protein [Betaproteobacteria bacterium]|nr:amino acid synthesis family protein [Betaproteobacteria bacterium]MBA3775946.1 amino acid synthesis family protein [Betaproteobacteria bacterium]
MTPDAIKVRKYVTYVEEIWHEGGPPAAIPHRKAAVAAVVHNPFAGRYVADIMPMMEALKPLGIAMARRLIDALGGDPKKIEAYGKGALIGLGGELEHGALWHVPGGYAMRELLAQDGVMSKAIVPSSKKVGPAGASIDIPIHHINAAYVRSHFNAIEMRVADAPRDNEIMFVLAMTDGPRVQHRAGGLKASEIKGEDGQR